MAAFKALELVDVLAQSAANLPKEALSVFSNFNASKFGNLKSSA